MKALIPSADEYTLCNATVPAVLLRCANFTQQLHAWFRTQASLM